MALAIAASAAATTRADAEDRRSLWRLDFAAPAGCPTAADFVKQVERRREHPGATTADERKKRLRVDLRPGPHGVVGRLTLETEGHSSEQSIEAADCHEAVDALALVAALAIDSGEPPPPVASAPSPAPPVASPAPSPSSLQTAPTTTAPAGTSALPPIAAPNPPAPVPAPAVPSPEPTPTPSPAPSPAPAPAATAEPSRIDVESGVMRPAPRLPVSFSASVEGLVSGGMAPEATGGWMALAGVAIGRSRTPGRPTVRVGVAGAPTLPFRGPEGTASFSWIAAVLEVCPVALALLRDAVVVRPCGVAEYGIIRASGSDTLDPASVSRPWGGAGLGLRLSWRIVGPVSLEASASVLGALERNRFLIASQEVFETPDIVARAGLGLGVDVP